MSRLNTLEVKKKIHIRVLYLAASFPHLITQEVISLNCIVPSHALWGCVKLKEYRLQQALTEVLDLYLASAESCPSSYAI